MMKKVVWLLLVVGLPFSAAAQEEIPLFFDTHDRYAPQSETPAVAAARAAVEEKVEPNQNAGRPRIGRGAKPLDSLVLVPLPNDEVSIQLNDKTPPSAPVVRPAVKKRDVITRANPVSMTERGDLSDAYLQSLLGGTNLRERPAARFSGMVQTAFGERYDVRGFAIADLMLGMTAEEIIDVAADNGYALKNVSYGMPESFRAYYESECRAQHLYLPDVVRACVTDMAKDAGVYHLTKVELVKPVTRESITVWLTSDATDNAAYKIQYVSKGDNSLNFSRPNLAKKMARKDHFWRQVFETYGMPDDGENLIWGDWRTAYMQAKMTGSAYDASLVLEDRTALPEDSATLILDAGEIPNPSPFTFSEYEGE